MNIIRIIIATALGLCVILGFIALAACDERDSVELRARKLAFAKRYRAD